MGSFSFRNERDDYTLKPEFIVPVADSFGLSSIFYNRHESEVGFGGFLPINRAQSIIINLWAGMGIGNTNINENNSVSGIAYQRNFRYQTKKIFWQPYISFAPSPYFNISYFFKFCRLFFSGVNTNMSEFELIPRRLNHLSGSSIPVSEGGYNINFGFRGMKGFRIQHQMSLAGSTGIRDIRGLNLSLGLQYNFGKTIPGKKDWLSNPGDRYPGKM